MKMTAAGKKKKKINGGGCGLVDVAEALHKSGLHTYQINRDGVCSWTSSASLLKVTVRMPAGRCSDPGAPVRAASVSFNLLQSMFASPLTQKNVDAKRRLRSWFVFGIMTVLTKTILVGERLKKPHVALGSFSPQLVVVVMNLRGHPEEPPWGAPASLPTSNLLGAASPPASEETFTPDGEMEGDQQNTPQIKVVG